MGVTVKIDTARLDAYARRLQSEPIAVLGRMAQGMADEMIRKIESPPKTGRIYGTHQASAPGEPPANDTGELAASITVESDGETVTLAARAPYAPTLEYGGAKIAPRPFFWNTIEDRWPEALGELSAAMKE
jgi:phage gpG-like protein